MTKKIEMVEEDDTAAELSEIWYGELFLQVSLSHVVYAAIACYIAYRIFLVIQWWLKNIKVHKLANSLMQQRNSKFEDFQIEKVGRDVMMAISNQSLALYDKEKASSKIYW